MSEHIITQELINNVGIVTLQSTLLFILFKYILSEFNKKIDQIITLQSEINVKIERVLERLRN